jgi:hypothetical protein
MRAFDFMKQLFVFATLAAASGGSALFIALVQQRCIREKRGLLPVYRVDVDRTDRIFVHCGTRTTAWLTQQVPSLSSSNANRGRHR